MPLVLFPFKLLSHTLADMKQFRWGPPALRKFFLGHWPSFKGHISAQCPAWIFQISLQLLPLQYTSVFKTPEVSERPLSPFNIQKKKKEKKRTTKKSPTNICLLYFTCCADTYTGPMEARHHLPSMLSVRLVHLSERAAVIQPKWLGPGAGITVIPWPLLHPEGQDKWCALSSKSSESLILR